MFSTTVSSLPPMMAHASSAGAPFDSEVSNADLDSEAFATTPLSATPLLHSSAQQDEAMQLDMLSQLLDTSNTVNNNNNTSTFDRNNATSTTTTTLSSPSTLLSDPSVIASATWTTSPSISPMVLKLESPMLSCVDQATATEETPAKPRSSRNKSKTTASSSTATSSESSNTNSRKRAAADPTDKEAKARERVLRNRAAAQESRDKKRKYVADIEASNDTLQQENTQLLKRLKTVESDNLALSQRLEALTAQFAQMQQLLSQSVKQTQPGVGFCQSAVLAKKDKKPRHQDILTNSQQQKLAPTQKSLYTTTSTPAAMPDKHRQVYSMTMMNSMSKKRLQNREARSLDRNAAQNRMETSCRPFCNHLTSCCNRTLTLSSSVAASFPTTRPSTTRQEFQATTALMMMVFLTNILPQLMLNFSTLFLISTGARSSNPQELQLQQVVLSFIQRQQLFWSRRLFRNGGPLHQGLTPQQQQPSAFFLTQSGTIKDTITSLDPSAIEEIVTEFRAGHRDVARGLLVKAFLSSRTNMMRLDKDKGDDDKVKKEWIRLLRKK